MSAVKIVSIRVKLRSGAEIELQADEARELFEELSTLFKKETPPWTPRVFMKPCSIDTPYSAPDTSPIFIPRPTTTDPLPPRWETICGPARSSVLEINLGG